VIENKQPKYHKGKEKRKAMGKDFKKQIFSMAIEGYIPIIVKIIFKVTEIYLNLDYTHSIIP